MPILILSLNLLFVRVSGSLTGVELRVVTGPQLKTNGIPADVSAHDDTVDVRIEDFVNPMAVLKKTPMTLILPVGSSVRFNLQAALSHLTLDFKKLMALDLRLDLKFSRCEVVFAPSASKPLQIYALGGNINIANAEGMTRGAFFDLNGTSVFLEARKPIPETLYFAADGASITLVLPSKINLVKRGFFNIHTIAEKRRYGQTEVILSGSFNKIKIL